jgi:hypothetical protein
MDDDILGILPGISGYSDFMDTTANLIKDESISLTGIYHINSGDKDDLGRSGVNPADRGDKSYNAFEGYLGDLFTRYEMGADGGYVSSALLSSVDTVGIIQRWTLSYQSPFNLSDGYKRQVVYSLEGFTDNNNTPIDIIPFIRDPNADRYYRVPEEKIEAYFVKPSTTNRKIYKENGKVLIEVRARSQYNEVQNDGSTQLTNYRIERGLFKLAGNGKTLILSSDFNEISISPVSYGWYKLVAEIDSDAYDSYFARSNISIDATVATKENGKTISISNVQIDDVIEPTITTISLTNDTLNQLLTELYNEEGVRLYTDDEAFELSNREITNADGLTLIEVQNFFNVSDNKLPIKAGDIISYAVEVEDESISAVNNSIINIGGNLASLDLSTNIYGGIATISNTSENIDIVIEDDFGTQSQLN